MRRLPSILLATCLIGLGCNTTPKKPPAAPKDYPNAPGTPAPFWSEDRPAKINGVNNGPKTEVEGLLAGMLIDSAGRPQPNALINVTAAGAGPNGKPIGIQADDQGYFMIKGLKTGVTYFLSVRGDDHGKVLGGSAMTQAPNTRLLIKLSEGNVSSQTPPSGTDPKPSPDKKDGKVKLEPPATSIPSPDPVKAPKDPLIEGSDQSWSPGKTPPMSRPLPPPPPASARNPNVADANNQQWPPLVNIPAVTPPPPPPATGPSMSAVSSNSSPLTGAATLAAGPRMNFTLYDAGGNPIEFSKLSDRRLIVLDFWATYCPPCLEKVPELVALQTRYTGYLDVVGIACDDVPFAKRKAAVDGIKKGFLRRSTLINYQILFEGEGKESHRVETQFRIESYPTLVLLDHSGQQLWRGRDVRILEEKINFYLQR